MLVLSPSTLLIAGKVLEAENAAPEQANLNKLVQDAAFANCTQTTPSAQQGKRIISLDSCYRR